MAWAAVGSVAGAALSGILGAPSGAQKAMTRAQTDQVRAQTQGLQQKNTQQADLYGQAAGLSTDPTKNVAGLSPEQLQAMNLTQGSLGYGQADNSNLSGSIAGANYGRVGAGDIAQFSNPYTDQVVNATNQDIDLQRQRAIAGNSSNASMNNAFGGSRQAVTDALTNEGALRTTAQADASIRQQGFNSATQAALQQANQSGGFRVAGNQQLSNLLSQRFGMNQTDIGNLSQQGATQQATDQAMKGWAGQRIGLINGVVQGFSPQGSAPGAFNLPNNNTAANMVQGAQWGSAVGKGIGDYFSQPNGGAQAAAFAASNPIAAAPDTSKMFGAFSDRRLKRDIERVATTGSGLGLYKFRYLWDRPGQLPRVGYMADEVKEIFPHAVSRHASGFDRVNYAQVT